MTEESNKQNEIWINKIKADGGAYKGCPKNDYCQHFVDTGERPQNFIRDYDEDKRFLDYPKLNELIKRKNEVLSKRATPPMSLKTDLKSFDLSVLGKFDVILIDPPWEEYYTSTDGVKLESTSNDSWTFDEIADLKIDQISEACSFLFLWVGNGKGLDYGRGLLKKWGFRRCEDIVWIKTNKHFNKKNYKDNSTLLQRVKEHCLVGIKGQVKRGADRHFIHANIDTDVIVSEEPVESNTEKPHELYRIIERFCLGRKRLELFGEDHNIRSGWLTLGSSLNTSNFDLERYNNWFIGDGMYPEIQNYEGGRYVGCTSEIENLRPRSPQKPNQYQNNLKQQQQQQQQQPTQVRNELPSQVPVPVPVSVNNPILGLQKFPIFNPLSLIGMNMLPIIQQQNLLSHNKLLGIGIGSNTFHNYNNARGYDNTKGNNK